MKTQAIFLSSLIIAARGFTINTSVVTRSTSLYSTPAPEEGEPEAELVLGTELSSALQGLGDEASMLATARKRTEEAKAKMMEQLRLEEEETERKRAEMKARNNPNPGDMSGFKDFADDGFEASADEGFDGAWDVPKEDAPQEEEPKLMLFDDNQQGGDNGGLIL